MALINCVECKKEISDSVKTCPHCGYKYKKVKFSFISKFDFSKYSRINIVALVFLVLGFISTFCNYCFLVVTNNDSYQFEIYKSFNEIFFSNSRDYGVYGITLHLVGIVAIILLAINVFKLKGNKYIDKITVKPIICYLPTFIYTVYVIYLSYYISEVIPSSEGWYTIDLGTFWVLILLISASGILIYNLINKQKKKTNNVKNVLNSI